MNLADRPTASVIVCTFRRDEPLRDTLCQLIAQNDGSYQIIVVDQLANHDAETTHFLDNEVKQGRLLYFNCDKSGLTFARNFGAARSSADILIYCDDDVILGEDWAQSHISSYDDENVTAVAGQVLHCGEHPSDERGSFRYWHPISDFQQLYGANFSIRKSIYFSLGGSDENLGVHAYTEDVILAQKLVCRGHRIQYNPKASVIHLQAARGGCRISDVTQTTEEWEKSYSKLYWFFLSPAKNGGECCSRLWEAVRHGPFRRSSVIRFWRQPIAWYGFFRALRKARRDATKARNSFQQL